MRKRLSVWQKVKFANKVGLPFWSSRIEGEGDTRLTKGSPRRNWKKIIVLKPTGNPETIFSMGFSSDIFGNTKISSATRKVKDGPFGMRMGPENCDFFIASKFGLVDLEFVEYADINDKSKAELSLY